MTVQDHRYFCPTRGKWTRAGSVCREPLRRELCADCFEDPAYFQEIMALTERRLDALRGLRCVTLSSYMRGELLEAGLAPERVSVVPPFVADLDPRAQPDGGPCVLFVGRLVEAKGVRDAVSAWRASGLALPLVFAGSGPLRAELEQDGHEVLGWQPRERLAATYRRAQVLVMPSRWQEPFGMAGLEALSLGVPVAAWDSGGVREWHPGGEGLVAWGDVPGLGRALASLAGRPATPPRAVRWGGQA
jgi:glycosyltransferase involved in cell wall biosynthesis